MSEQHTRKFLGDQELAIVMFDGLFFFLEFLTRFTFGGCNFPQIYFILDKF